MKDIFKILLCIYLSLSLSIEAKAQSSIVTYSPSTSTMFGDATRFGCHYNDWSTYYVRYNDSSYFCYTLDLVFLYAAFSTKLQFEPSFIITDFKSLVNIQCFIGSYQGVGMHGFFDYNYSSPSTSHNFYVKKLSAVDNLKRMAGIKTSDPAMFNQTKAFAIGEKSHSSDAPPKNYILEFYAIGIGFSSPYYYAQLPFNTAATGERETADDVITLDHYVIFATRDTRNGHAPVNLRISDTTNVLQNADIGYQWQFLLSSYEKVVSELRLLPLDDNYFVLTYIKHDSRINKYYLCVHRIHLHDFLAGNNTIVSREILIDGSCTDLVDVIFDPTVRILVTLLNGTGKSELYHDDPYATINSPVSKLTYSDGNFYSIDTLGEMYSSSPDYYIAAGDSVFFTQNISNGVVIEESCLEITDMKSLLCDSPKIRIIYDPLESFCETKFSYQMIKQPKYFEGFDKCNFYKKANP